MNNSIKKGVVVAIILLFISVSVIPTTGNRVSFDDITPPITTCTLDPPEPNGNNGWYVSDVEVTLNATDDMSGVNATYYRINEGDWETYVDPFVIEIDGYYLIEYYSVDNARNIEDVKAADFKIDTWIMADINYGLNNQGQIILYGNPIEYLSGTNKVEFYYCGELIGIDYEEPYEAVINSPLKGLYPVKGLIYNPQFYNDSISFYAIIVLIKEHTYTYFSRAFDNAGNMDEDHSGAVSPPSIKSFQRLTFLTNEYIGYIGRFLINAKFKF